MINKKAKLPFNPESNPHWKLIFCFLNFSDLVQARQVCKRSYKLSNDGDVRRKALEYLLHKTISRNQYPDNVILEMLKQFSQYLKNPSDLKFQNEIEIYTVSLIM